MVARRTAMKRAAVLLLIAAPALAAAQWEVREVEHNGDAVETATVEGSSGERLSVYRENDSQVIAEIELGPGLDAFAGCPTLLIDERAPVVVGRDGERCELDARSARFGLGEIVSGELASPITLALMNGKRLRFMIRLREGGYREIMFSLRGSKQALASAIGNVRVTE